MLQWRQKQGSIYVPVKRQIESGGQTYQKAGQGNKNKKKKRILDMFMQTFAKKVPPPPAGSDANVLTLYTPT